MIERLNIENIDIDVIEYFEVYKHLADPDLKVRMPVIRDVIPYIAFKYGQKFEFSKKEVVRIAMAASP